MTDQPGTLFERHPRPWKLQWFPQTYLGSTGYHYVMDANGATVATGQHHPFGEMCASRMVDAINADAPKPPKPFEPGWYWARNKADDVGVFKIHTPSAAQGMADAGWTIGPRIEKPEF